MFFCRACPDFLCPFARVSLGNGANFLGFHTYCYAYEKQAVATCEKFQGISQKLRRI